MSLLLDPPRIAGDAVASAADALLVEWATCDLNDLSIPELDAASAVADRVASYARGLRVRMSVQGEVGRGGQAEAICGREAGHEAGVQREAVAGPRTSRAE